MRKLSVNLVFGLTLSIVLLSGCAMVQRPLELSEIIIPQIEVVETTEGYVLRISGNCSYSGHVVEKVQQLKQQRTIQVMVITSPFERDGYGKFFTTDVALDQVDIVTFGAREEILWRRNPNTIHQ